MEKKVLLVCVTVGILGLLTAALGFAAEANKIKLYCVFLNSLPSEVRTTTTGCSYPRSAALALGLFASVALMIAQAIINISAGCICCKRNPHPSTCGWTTALACFIFSWFTFVIAFLLLLTGSALNDQHGQESMYFSSYCYVVKPGVFAGGAILSLVSLTLGIVYYVLLSSVKNSGPWGVTAAYPHQGSIAMGQPQFPPQAQTETAAQPVFVPEDTYIRRQYP